MKSPALLLGAACLASAALAQDAIPTEPGQVTDAQIALVQDNIEVGCVNRGLQRKSPESEVRAVCACITNVIRQQVPKDEMRQIVVSAYKDDDNAAQATFLAHEDAMMACKKP
jgi:hypothetical protein